MKTRGPGVRSRRPSSLSPTAVVGFRARWPGRNVGESYAQPQESIACFSSCVVPVSAIAIVGGAGFIGRRLSAILQDTGHDVRVIDVQPRPLPPSITDTAMCVTAMH